jgi:hypothetical protein
MKLHTALLAAALFAACQSETDPGDTDPSDAPDTLGAAPEVTTPSPAVTRRLTESQYENAMRDLFGDDVYVPSAPEPDLRLAGLARLGAAEVTVSPRGVERYESAAYALAAQAVAPEGRAAWMPCEPAAGAEDTCAREALASLGRRAWRRTLTADELDTAMRLANEAEAALAGEDDVAEPFWEGLQYGIAYLLQSPDFLMRPEPVADPAEGGTPRYTGVAMAGRLSFFLWDSLPDDVLLDAAEAGDLERDAGLAAQVDRMIADPRARRGLRAWVDDLLHLTDVPDLQKDPTAFPFLQDGMLESAREETLLLFEDQVFDRDADVRELLTTRRTFIDRKLAMAYGVEAPSRDGFAAVELPEDGDRVGLFGHMSILSLYAHPRSSSATLRGKFVRSTLLCGLVPPPPANVNTNIPEASPDAPTLRDRIAVHLEDPACSTCHLVMDPIGLGLENFDGMGIFRETEANTTIDASGDLDGTPFEDLPTLAAAVAGHDDFVPCLVEQVTRAAMGRTPNGEERAAMSWLEQRFFADELRMIDLWRALALSPMFRTAAEPDTTPSEDSP